MKLARNVQALLMMAAFLLASMTLRLDHGG
jgi:hypothetical protein